MQHEHPEPPKAFNRAKILEHLKNGRIKIAGSAFPYVPLTQLMKKRKTYENQKKQIWLPEEEYEKLTGKEL
jgi:hypothetical protein